MSEHRSLLPTRLLFPKRCPICRRLIEEAVLLCPGCARALRPTGAHARQNGDLFDACYSPFYYREPLRSAFLRYKFEGFRHYAPLFGRWMADCLNANEVCGFDLVTWVPLSSLRRMRRGYDQAQLLAAEISERLNLPLQRTLKCRYHRPLSGMRGEQALRSARMLNTCRVRRGSDVRGRHILLVDDIITTGATLNECARMLKTAGAAEVVCVTLARK